MAEVSLTNGGEIVRRKGPENRGKSAGATKPPAPPASNPTTLNGPAPTPSTQGGQSALPPAAQQPRNPPKIGGNNAAKKPHVKSNEEAQAERNNAIEILKDSVRNATNTREKRRDFLYTMDAINRPSEENSQKIKGPHALDQVVVCLGFICHQKLMKAGNSEMEAEFWENLADLQHYCQQVEMALENKKPGKEESSLAVLNTLCWTAYDMVNSLSEESSCEDIINALALAQKRFNSTIAKHSRPEVQQKANVAGTSGNWRADHKEVEVRRRENA
jgi:hypothetical protein